MRRWLHRQLNAITRWGFTIMVVPRRGGVRRVAVPWLGAIGLVAVVGTIGYFFLVYYPSSRVQIGFQRATIHKLNTTNERLDRENKQIEPTLERCQELETTLNRLQNEVAAVAAAYGSIRRKSPARLSSRSGSYRVPSFRLPEPVVSPKDGKVSLLATLNVDAKSLTDQVDRQLAAARELKKELLAYERQLDHTPSIWPLYGRLTSYFGGRRDPVAHCWTHHDGVDLATHTGTPVRAAADGVVKTSGWRSGYGRTIVISHGYSYETLYAHNSSLLVQPEQLVKKGQLIAYSGSSGKSTGPHLHFEVWVNGKPVNPSAFMH